MTQPVSLRTARSNHEPPLTQEQLAEQSGVDQTYISLIERGLRTPSEDIQKRLAAALGVAPSELDFAEPSADSSLGKSYDRTGQTSSPTELGQITDVAPRGEDRLDGERRDGDRRRSYERRREAS